MKLREGIYAIIHRVWQWREGAAVERCHGTPHHGSYSVGAHTYGAVLLMLLLHPTLRKTLMRSKDGRMLLALLVHDLPERYLGDLYGPAKSTRPKLGEAYAVEEKDVAAKLGLADIFDKLEPSERQWVSSIDAIELYHWVLEQTALGNQHVERMKHRVHQRIAESGAPEIVKRYLGKVFWYRTDEDLED